MMQELDKRVAELYGITDDELVEIETDLKLLLYMASLLISYSLNTIMHYFDYEEAHNFR